MIHAVYLVNCASDDPEIRAKSLDAVTLALRAGDQLGARGVVLHPGSAKTGHVGEAIDARGATFREALAESDRCPLLLEDTAGAGGTLGRSFEELAALLEAAAATSASASAWTLPPFASGFDVRTRDGLAAVLDQCDAHVGLDRLRCLHVNDSNGFARTSTATRRSAGASSARRVSRCSCPSRASRACRRSSRDRAPAARRRAGTSRDAPIRTKGSRSGAEQSRRLDDVWRRLAQGTRPSRNIARPPPPVQR